MIHSFNAIDLETAHNKRWIICQVGFVRIEHGKIRNEINLSNKKTLVCRVMADLYIKIELYFKNNI